MILSSADIIRTTVHKKRGRKAYFTIEESLAMLKRFDESGMEQRAFEKANGFGHSTISREKRRHLNPITPK